MRTSLYIFKIYATSGVRHLFEGSVYYFFCSQAQHLFKEVYIWGSVKSNKYGTSHFTNKLSVIDLTSMSCHIFLQMNTPKQTPKPKAREA